MSNGCIVLDKKMCPDPLEALKPSGTPTILQHGGVGGRSPSLTIASVSPPLPYGLPTALSRGILTSMPS